MATRCEAPVPVPVPESAVVDVPFVAFPPFPSPPPGVTIVPFKHFKEHGIRVFAQDGVEVDGLGIPTVALRVKHDTDKCKSNAERRTQRAIPSEAKEMKRKKEWWEVWAEREDQKALCIYNRHDSDFERFHQAAADFKKTRVWPSQTSGVAALWDQFRLFSGLLTNTPIWRKVDPNKQDDDDGDDDDNDNLSEEEDQNDVADIVVDRVQEKPKNTPVTRHPRPPYENYHKAPVEVQDEQEVQELLDDAAIQKDQKLEVFLSDPEKAMKIFLSSYMRNQGFIWSDRNLVAVPQLVSFFVNFILRNRVLPEYERDFRRAADIIEIAKRELPLTSAVGKALPGEFSKACEMFWGRRSSGFEPIEVPSESEESPQPKRQKVDPMPEAVKEFEAELQAANLKVVSVNNVDLTADVIADNVGDDVKVTPDVSGWGESTWGVQGESQTWGDSTAWNEVHNAWDAPDVSGWEDHSPSLINILGPTALPITHAPGIVEWSMRRIKAVFLPSSSFPAFESSTGPSPVAVEAALDARFAKMVLEPWPNWDDSREQDLSSPKILPKSRGALVSDMQVDTGSLSTGAAKGKAHDMVTDDITVLVPPSAVDILVVGMGLGATWIELARQALPENSDTAKSGKKKKGKKKGNYWYMEQLMAILPSYYLAK